MERKANVTVTPVSVNGFKTAEGWGGLKGRTVTIDVRKKKVTEYNDNTPQGLEFVTIGLGLVFSDNRFIPTDLKTVVEGLQAAGASIDNTAQQALQRATTGLNGIPRDIRG